MRLTPCLSISLSMKYNLSDMDFYEIPETLKVEIGKAITENPNVKEVFGAIAKHFYPNLKTSALLVGEKIELVSYKA